MMSDYAHLLPYCTTKKQEQLIQFLCQGHGLKKAVAAGHSSDQGSLCTTLRRLKAKAALQDKSAHALGAVPDGFSIKGVSTLINKDGEQVAQWIKSNQDAERQAELMRESVAAMCEDIPRAKAVKAPPVANYNLLNLYVITDYHFGMLSWAEETGEDWDVHIAESLLVKWFEQAIASSPNADTGILCNLGDFLHQDGMEALTPTGRNLLDADSRFAKIVRIIIRCLRQVIDMLLQKHKTLHLIMAEGNHDMASSVWLREMFAAMYADEPRIKVDVSPDPYYCVEWGKTSLFFHHGHKKKPASVDDVFAAKFREVFGRTKFSYAHLGHMHHVWQKETNLMIVEQHRTLAAKDAYASRGGWLSGREASCITYHKEYGQAGRITITPDMVRGAA
jgi:hypothetical protein